MRRAGNGMVDEHRRSLRSGQLLQPALPELPDGKRPGGVLDKYQVKKNDFLKDMIQEIVPQKETETETDKEPE